jgi:hypothetical protein
MKEIVSVPLEQQIIRTAYHEAGHIVAAAVQGLKLRPEGLAVDARGEGLACYCKQPGDSDETRESVIITTFSGYNSESKLCLVRDFSKPDEMLLIFSCDAREARPIISQLSYLSVERTAFQIEEELQNRSRQLIEREWKAIQMLAEVLLAKEWEPVRSLPSGTKWTHENLAKYVDGKEAIERIARYEITATIAESC